jgi:hypothetical protein
MCMSLPLFNDYKPQPFRPGDFIARCFSRLGFRSCQPCARRQQRINRAWAMLARVLKRR